MKSKTNIVLIDALNARSGGAVVIAHETSKALSKTLNKDDKVVLIQLDEGTNYDSDLGGGIERVLIKASKYSVFYLIRWHLFILPKLIKKYNVTHLVGLGGFVFGKYGSKKTTKIVCINNALPFISPIELHEFFPELKFRIKWYLLKRIYCYSIKASDNVLLSSNYMKSLISCSCDVDDDKVIVELTGYNERLKNISIGIPEKTSTLPVLFYLSPLWKYKNHEVIIRALGVLKKQFNKKFRVVFAGGECQENIVNELKSIALENDVLQDIEFVGNVNESQRDNLLLESDVLLYSSYYEANSVILSEYMSIGKPIVCSDSASNKEVLNDSALYFKPDDCNELAKQILILISNREMVKELTGNASKRIKELTWESYALKLWGKINT